MTKAREHAELTERTTRSKGDVSAQVHGMGKELVSPSWPPLAPTEIREVLAHYGAMSGTISDSDDQVLWSSPRPMSVGALIRSGQRTTFVKRHHRSVRTPDDLRVEHAFARHLRLKGIRVPEVFSTPEGETVVERGDYLYELHAPLQGFDLYRDAVSWSPFKFTGHARAAGRALAKFHLAARDFAAPARPHGVLRDSAELGTSNRPQRTLENWLRDRPALDLALSSRTLATDFSAHLQSPIEAAADAIATMKPQWTHGDWHASNLTWTSPGADATVAEVFDLGLSNRTFAVHDLALAIERNTIDWLDLAGHGAVDVDLAAVGALVSGYGELAPLSPAEHSALVAVLPVVHVDYALSEVEYFAAVAKCTENVDLAYRYLIEHTAWFETEPGKALLDHLRATYRES